MKFLKVFETTAEAQAFSAPYNTIFYNEQTGKPGFVEGVVVPSQPNDEIWYTTTDGEVLYIDEIMAFGFDANITSNTYSNNKGIVKFDKNLTSIDSNTFNGYTSIVSLSIPGSVATLGSNAFYNCSDLESITFFAVNPPTAGSAILDSTHDCPIYVPAVAVDTYKAASGWSNYAARIQAIQ